MNDLLGLLIGVCLAAACGFRIFVPFLGISLAARSGNLHLAPSFEWMASDVALTAFAIATVLEVLAYYIPWVDNLLDAAATPAAVVAGSIVTAAMITDMSPFLKWSLAIIAGGGVAATVQAGTVALRGASTVTTGGITNSLVASGELAGAVATSWLAIAVPVVCAVLVGLLLFVVIRKLWRVTHPRSAPPTIPSSIHP
jgi:hypothetical protein